MGPIAYSNIRFDGTWEAVLGSPEEVEVELALALADGLNFVNFLSSDDSILRVDPREVIAVQASQWVKGH
jgi:hypothetical protein